MRRRSTKRLSGPGGLHEPRAAPLMPVGGWPPVPRKSTDDVPTSTEGRTAANEDLRSSETSKNTARREMAIAVA
jgi:hypothetical protein